MTIDNQNKFDKCSKILIDIAIILICGAIAWATLKGKVEQTIETVDKYEVRITATEQQVSEVKLDIREIRVEQRYIKEGINDIKKLLTDKSE